MTEGCACVNVEMGSYDAQIEMVPPWGVREDGHGICVDACIALEVHKLWQQGIRTTGCCCGHNTAPAYIGVREEHIPDMLRLGYEVLPNTSRPGARDSFRARSAPPKEAEPWRPIEDAPKDRTPVLAAIHPDLFPRICPGRPDLERWNGQVLVIHHPGLAEDGFDVGWSVSAPVGTGIGRDDWFSGWMPLPSPPDQKKG